MCQLKELIQMAKTESPNRNRRIALQRETNTYRTSAVGTLKKKPTSITFVVVGTEKKKDNTNHIFVVGTEKKRATRITLFVVGTEKNLTDRNYVMYAVRTIPTRIICLRKLVGT